MRELHLFSGDGGGILSGILCGDEPICAVEINAGCRKVLLQRQRDGILPWFPLWPFGASTNERLREIHDTLKDDIALIDLRLEAMSKTVKGSYFSDIVPFSEKPTAPTCAELVSAGHLEAQP